jgi:hypothetical protein
MISREEYERLITNFIVEVNHILLHTREEDLLKLPTFHKAMGSYLDDLRNPTRDPSQALYSAFGLVDEFVHADFSRVLALTYEAHQRGSN